MTSHRARAQQQDEYFCSACGKRWAVDEAEPRCADENGPTEAMDLAKTLEGLSAAATQGGITPSFLTGEDNDPDIIFTTALWNAYRTGKLVVVPDDAAERMAELQLAAFLAGRGSVTSMKHGTRAAKPGPTMDDYRRMALAALKGADHAG